VAQVELEICDADEICRQHNPEHFTHTNSQRQSVQWGGAAAPPGMMASSAALPSGEWYEPGGDGRGGAGLYVLVSTNLTNWQVLFTTNSPVTPVTLVDTNFSDPFSAPVRFYRIQLGP